MNSIVKINEKAVVDLMLIRAISYDYGTGMMMVYFMRHDLPLEVECDYDLYLDFYTKWRSYAEWKLQLMMGELANG